MNGFTKFALGFSLGAGAAYVAHRVVQHYGGLDRVIETVAASEVTAAALDKVEEATQAVRTRKEDAVSREALGEGLAEINRLMRDPAAVTDPYKRLCLLRAAGYSFNKPPYRTEDIDDAYRSWLRMLAVRGQMEEGAVPSGELKDNPDLLHRHIIAISKKTGHSPAADG